MRSQSFLAVAILAATAAIAAEAVLPPMSIREKAELVDVLKRDRPAAVTIACAGAWCQELSSDLKMTFAGQGWNVNLMHGGDRDRRRFWYPNPSMRR